MKAGSEIEKTNLKVLDKERNGKEIREGRIKGGREEEGKRPENYDNRSKEKDKRRMTKRY